MKLRELVAALPTGAKVNPPLPFYFIAIRTSIIAYH